MSTPMVMTTDEAEREKSNAALYSVYAAFFLTFMKVVVGFSTNSLGVLSEALHSSFDLVAAGITLFAIRLAASPADSGHPYGHGKIENLAALGESLLLLMTCVWIVWEAINRLFFNPAQIQLSLWAVGVMVISIIVDISRSRMLHKMAKKHRSQALEADAMHFTTDIWSSCVVLLGLGALYLAELLPMDSAFRPWLECADAIAALSVSCIIVYIVWKLCKKSISVLLDAGDIPLTRKLHELIEEVEGLLRIEALRIRQSGANLFIDMELIVDSTHTLDAIEILRKDVTALVLSVVPYAEVSVAFRGNEAEAGQVSRIRLLAITHGLSIHAIEMYDIKPTEQGHKQIVELHAEFPPEMPLAEAHDLVTPFELAVEKMYPNTYIVTHMEPREKVEGSVLSTPKELEEIQQKIHDIVADEEDAVGCHKIIANTSSEGGHRVSFHCLIPGAMTVEESHEISRRLNTAIRKKLPNVKRATIHIEPQK